MLNIKGKIYHINELSDKSCQIVIKKQVDGKIQPIAINLFGFWKQKAEELKLKKNDKIEARVYIKSNLFKGKYYTELYFKEIFLVQDGNKGQENNNELFIPTTYIIDEETGEILL